MPIRSFVQESPALYRLNEGGGEVVFDLAALGVQLNSAGVEKLRLLIQGEFDTRIKLRDLPDDDPRKTIDPASAKEFWEGKEGNRTLVSRGVEVVIRFNPSIGEFEFVFKRAGELGDFMDAF